MIKFLSKRMILHFHEDLLIRYGGKPGLRDEKLLESALAQPEATFEGEYLHNSIYEMTAAYGFHLCKNHPFIDGNKRIALIAMFTFLYVNGYKIQLDEKKMYLLIMSIADGTMSKENLTKYLKKHIVKC